MKRNSETLSLCSPSLENDLLGRLFRESKAFRKIVLIIISSLGVFGVSCAPQTLPPPNATINGDYSEVFSTYWKAIEQAYVNQFGQKKANELMDQLWRKIANYSQGARARFLKKFADQLLSSDESLILMPSPQSFCTSLSLTIDGDPELGEATQSLEMFYCSTEIQQ